jgi:hypothetical protein
MERPRSEIEAPLSKPGSTLSKLGALPSELVTEKLIDAGHDCRYCM